MDIHTGEIYGKQTATRFVMYNVLKVGKTNITLQNIDNPLSLFETTAQKLQSSGYICVSHTPYIDTTATTSKRRKAVRRLSTSRTVLPSGVAIHSIPSAQCCPQRCRNVMQPHPRWVADDQIKSASRMGHAEMRRKRERQGAIVGDAASLSSQRCRAKALSTHDGAFLRGWP